MRFTDAQIDAMQRTDVINALRYSENVYNELAQHQNRVAAAEQALAQIQTQLNAMQRGLGKSSFLFAGFGGMILGWILVSFSFGLILAAAAAAGVFVLDRKVLAAGRSEKALAFQNANLPAALQQHEMAVQALNAFCESDDLYNADLIVPASYRDYNAIEAMIRILEDRRANNLTAAINVLVSDMQHSSLMNLTAEQLSATREGVAAQKRTAAATEDTARTNRRLVRNTDAMALSQAAMAANMARVAENTRLSADMQASAAASARQTARNTARAANAAEQQAGDVRWYMNNVPIVG